MTPGLGGNEAARRAAGRPGGTRARGPDRETAEFPIFAGLGVEARAAVKQIFTVSRRHAGERLLTGSEGRRSLLLVIAGRVRVVSIGLNGREVTLHRFCSGSVAGLRNMLPGEPSVSAVEVVAETTATVAAASTASVSAASEEHPELTRVLLAEAVRQLSDAEEFARRIASLPVEARVAGALLEHTGLDEAMAVPREALACRAAVRRESVSRALRRLGLKGLIRLQGRSVAIADIAGLQAIASPGEAAPCYGTPRAEDGGCG